MKQWKVITPSFLKLLLIVFILLLLLVLLPLPSFASSLSNNNHNHNSDGDSGNTTCINNGLTEYDDDEDEEYYDCHIKNDDSITKSSSSSSSYKLRQCIKVLKERKAHLCWHKHSTFLQHLISVHDILQRWIMIPPPKESFNNISSSHDDDDNNNNNNNNNKNETTIIPRIGLFHSAYSNSYVNLALFNITTERHIVQQLIGHQAEEYVYIFCNINRQDIVVNTLLHHNYIPHDGIYVPHLHNTNETIYLSSHTLYILLIFTMADIADQYFDYQDILFGGGNTNGSMILPGYDIYVERHNTKTLWPGLSKPGLWMTYVSQLYHVARTYYNDHHHNTTTMTTTTTSTSKTSVYNNQYNNNTLLHQLDISILQPLVFNSGTSIILPNDELEARDLYWSVISGEISSTNNNNEMVIITLQSCIQKNPYIFEPLVLLAQIYAHENDYNNTIFYANMAIKIQQQWGIAWDKRMSYDAWVAWTKVLLQRAQQQLVWPTNAWDVNNLGYVS